MFTDDVISLTEMTPEIAGAYFKDFAFDDAVFLEGQSIHPFVYRKQWLTGYLERNKDSVHLAIMLKDALVGEILFKRIDRIHRNAVFSIHLQNDSVKEKGYRTIAEWQAIEYAFNTLHMKALYVDSIKKNCRSSHALEKVSFRFVKEDSLFKYYEIRNPNRQSCTVARRYPDGQKWPEMSYFPYVEYIIA